MNRIANLFFLRYTVVNEKSSDQRFLAAMQNGKLLSVIIPSYNEQDMIPTTFQTVKESLDKSKIPFEIIFVDDGSRDLTGQHIHHIHRG